MLQPVFGKGGCPGCRVVDCDRGDKQVPGALQDGDSHGLRAVRAREQKVPESTAGTAFIRTGAPQLTLALGLRAQPIEDAEFARQAAALHALPLASLEAPAHPRGIHHLSASFRATVYRLSEG